MLSLRSLWCCPPALLVAWLLPSAARAQEAAPEVPTSESWFAARGAQADGPAASRQQMVRQMRSYYGAERVEGFAFMGLGAASIAAGVLMLPKKNTDFVRGAAVPMLTMGVIEFVGVGIYALTLGSQMDRQEAKIQLDPLGYHRDEARHLEGTLGRFEIYRTAEILLLMGGAGLVAAGSVDNNDKLRGAGAALAGHSIVLLALDHFAERRARSYLHQIRAFQPTAGVSLDGSRWFGVGRTGVF